MTIECDKLKTPTAGQGTVLLLRGAHPTLTIRRGWGGGGGRGCLCIFQLPRQHSVIVEVISAGHCTTFHRF